MKCDVLVVGAGVAGCVAALKALEQGLDVVIVEKDKRIAESIDTKLDLTESIGIEHIIDELDLPIHDSSNKSKWFSPNQLLNYNSSFFDLYVKRGDEEDSFENICVSKIQDKGGILLTDTYIKNVDTSDNDNVNKVQLKSKNKSIEIKPAFFIGADGIKSKVLELSGLKQYESILGEFNGYGVFGTDFNIPVGVTHVFLNRISAPGGYIFATRSNQNQCVLGVGFDPFLSNKTPEDHYNIALKDTRISNILKNAHIKNHLQGYGRYGILKHHARGNILLVGDAGRFLDPFLCYGVRQAILSGYNAASVCKDALDSSLKLEVSCTYELSMKELQDQVKLGLFLRKAYRKIDNNDLDAIVKIIADAQDDGLDVDNLFKENNAILIKNILKNGGSCTKMFLKSFPYLVEYLLKTHHQ